MAGPDKDRSYTPEELTKARTGVDLKDAVAGGPTPPPGQPGAPEAGAPHPTGAEVAEQARRQAQARPESRPERDEKLVNDGRGNQTTGRL